MAKRDKELRGDGEEAFLAGYDPEDFDRPSVTVDVALLTIAEGALQVSLVRRRDHPERGKWALPGGFVRMDETLDDAAARVLAGKTGLRGVFLEQLYTFGDPGRDPRTRVITVAYYALVVVERLRGPETAGDAVTGDAVTGDAVTSDAVTRGRIHVPWKGEAGGPVEVRDSHGGPLPLAFDHAEILGMAVKRLRGKLDYSPVGFQLLPERFTLRRLQDVHQSILGHGVNKDSFRRRMLASGLLAATSEHETEVGHRPAELYRFTERSAI